MTIRVFLLDDHELVRRGVKDLIEADGDIEVVGEAATVDEAVRRVPAARPDVAILDVRLPDGSGVEACRDIRSSHPEQRWPALGPPYAVFGYKSGSLPASSFAAISW